MTEPVGRIYWANAGAQTISCANLDGGEARDLCSTPAPPWGLTLDRRKSWLYYSLPGPHEVRWVDLEGHAVDGNPVGVSKGPFGLATDYAHGVPRTYFCGVTVDGVWTFRLELGGMYPELQGVFFGAVPDLLAFDPAGVLYGGYKTGILFSSAPAPNEPALRTSGPVCGVAVEVGARTIYWTSPTLERIEKAALGTGSFEPKILATPGATVAKPSGIAVDAKGERVYWANRKGGVKGAGTISWAQLDGTGGGDIEIAGATLEEPYGIAVLLAPSVATLPTISGGSIVGGKPLQCDPGSCAPDEPGGFVFRDSSSTAFQWLLEGKPIQGATEPTCSPQQGGCYSCAVTYVNPAGETVAEPEHSHYVQKEG